MKKLKKAGAVALAAVMAVTFAPIASLNALASTGVEKDGKTIKGAATLDTPGDFVIDSTYTTGAITIPYTADAGDYKIDLNGKEVSQIDIGEAPVNVIIYDSDKDKNNTYGNVTKLELGKVATGDASARTAKSQHPSLTVNKGTMTEIKDTWGNITVNDGVIKKIKIAKAADVSNKGQGANEIESTWRTSTLTINGGEFDDGWYDNEADATALASAGTKNDEQLKSMSIVGGYFTTTNPQTLTYFPKDTDNTTDKVNGIDKATPVATLTMNINKKGSEVGVVVGNDFINKYIDKAKAKALDDAANKDTANITVENGPVALKDVPAGVVATVTSLTNKGENDGKSLTAAAKSGVSMYHETKADKNNNDTKKTVIDTYFFGDGSIGKHLNANAVGEALTADAAKYNVSGEFKNGGDTLEVDIDGKKYVVARDLINTTATANKTEKVNVVCLKSANRGIAFDGVQNATVTANKKYTVLTGVKDSSTNKVVEVSMEKVVDSTALPDGSTAGTVNVHNTAVNVEQIGTSEIADGANGMLVIRGLDKDTAKVTTTDVTLPLSYDENIVPIYYVGDAANQWIANSSVGQDINNRYAVAKQTDQLKTLTPKTNGTITFVQGGLTLPDVAVDKNLYNKDDTATAITFVDGAELGITKTANYGTNEQGIYSVYSVDVTVGTGANVPKQVCRFKNIATGVHLYTIDAGEIEDLTKSGEWKLENAQAFKVLPYNTTVAGAVPVRRYMNVHTGEFLYSTDVNGEQKVLDKSSDWLRQGIAFCGVAPGKGYAITRVRNTIKGDHVYSTSYKGEVEPLLTKPGYEVDGWPFEAVDIPANEK